MLIVINLYAQQEVQEIKGKVIFISSKGEVLLAGAFVHWSGKSSGVFTNNKGQFLIENGDNDKLVASFASYKSDTILINNTDSNYLLVLKEQNDLKTAVVIAKRISYGLSKLSPRTTILLGEREFQKAACCNLSESF